jgi:hypothetical protein
MDMNSLRAFDKRLVERRLRKGELSLEQYQAHLASLEDLAGRTDSVTARVESNVFAARQRFKFRALSTVDDDDDDDFEDDEDESLDEESSDEKEAADE